MLLAEVACLLFISACLNIQVRAHICHIYSRDEGVITDGMRGNLFSEYFRCWQILVPQSKLARITVTKVKGLDCLTASLSMTIKGTDELVKFCNDDPEESTLTTYAMNDVQIYFYLSMKEGQKKRRVNSNFAMQYEILDLLCVQKDSFACSNISCIPKAAVCDGIKDCHHGIDEVGCAQRPGVIAFSKVDEIHEVGMDWLKSKQKSWGWGTDTPRALIGMYLSSDYSYNSSPNFDDDFMSMLLELKTGISFLRNETEPLTANQLGTFVNAFLVTCHNPRNFFRLDLVQLLKDRLEASPETTHPMAYLALCNAHERLSPNAVTTLVDMLERKSDYPFYLDVKAAALMVLSCLENNTNMNNLRDSDILLYYQTIEHFKSLQSTYCISPENIYTTALVVQALLSSGEDPDEDMELRECIHYLADHIDSSSVDFLSVYWTLPILRGKSFAHIANYDCLRNERFLGRGLSFDNFKINWQMNISVQYSLYIGDEKNVIHTMNLLLPENVTAYQVMLFAELIDYNFRFKTQELSGSLYANEISGITNDAEAGKYWLLYLKSPATNETSKRFLHADGKENPSDAHVGDFVLIDDKESDGTEIGPEYMRNSNGLNLEKCDGGPSDSILPAKTSERLQQFFESPKDLIIEDADHLIMWFKTVLL